MTSIILALALGQSLNLNDTPVRQGRGYDGGVTWGVFCVNCSGGGGSGGTVTQGTGFDGGGFWNVRSVLFNSGNAEVGTLLNPLQVNATPLEADSFSAAVVATRYNQVEIDYSTTAPASIPEISITTSGGGNSANSNGQAVFATSTGATGSVKAVTALSISYRPQAEVYAAFSAVFTTGTAGSIQRLGIYDTNNGFFLGYEGTSFGVTLRKAGVDTRTAQASFNLDTLTGGASSKYTRAGVPEAADFTRDQLYRIRFGWLGAAPIVWEILSPDGKWVAFHVQRHPNTTTSASINSPNLPITLEATKTSGATDISIKTACWAAGTTSNLIKVSDTITGNTLASMGRSVITGVTTGGGGGYVNVKVTPSGAITSEVTQASFPWLVAGADGGRIAVDQWNGRDGGSAWDVAGTVSVSNFPATQPVSGTVTANAGTGSFTVAQATAANLNATVTGTVTANQGGTWTVADSDLQALDTTNGGAVPANVLAIGLETATQGTTQPTAATAGTLRRGVISTDGALYTRLGGPVTWQCSLDAIAATLTQCQAAPAAGLRLYVTDISIQSTTATAGQFLLRQGTGTNCGTGTASIFPSAATVVRYGYPANTAAQPSVFRFSTPVVLTAANALCVLCVATNTCTVAIQGYTAP